MDTEYIQTKADANYNILFVFPNVNTMWWNTAILSEFIFWQVLIFILLSFAFFYVAILFFLRISVSTAGAVVNF